MSTKNNKELSVSPITEQNAAVIAELIVDPATTEFTRIRLINKLAESTKNRSFFDTMLKELLDIGNCPNCGHTNHWAIPEVELNKRGVVTCQEDSRVKDQTTIDDCVEYQEACGKKKLNF